MAGIESGEHPPEIRIILVSDTGLNEIKPVSEVGTTLLNEIRATLALGIGDGSLATNPFVVAEPEETSKETRKTIVAPPSTNRQHTLELATAAYIDKLQDHRLLAEFMQAQWDYHGIELMGLSERDTRVDDVPYKDDEIWQFMKLENPQPGNPGADLGYFHLSVLASADEKTRLLIGKGFPYMGSWVFQSGYNIRNGHQISGWMRVDASLDAPFRTNNQGELTGLNEDELKKAIKVVGREGQTTNIYGSSGDVINKILKYFPDQKLTWSRVPESSLVASGSLRDSEVLNAYFSPDGGLFVNSHFSRLDRSWDMGGRSFQGA